ncbi:MAG: beta-N-acetylhexosaminidase [Treponema sp.]|nr:beta-N-acetylhexosaminidase [Treponema sp.]
MTLKEKIGQKISIGIAGTSMNDHFKKMVKEYKAGNVILFRHSLIDAKHAKQFCKEIREFVFGETGHYPFISVDQEGGTVVRLPQDMINIPGAMALAASGSTENITLSARITAAELRRVGINMNLSPCLDINCNRDNPVIGNRSYAVDTENVSLYSSALIKAYEEEGLMSCGKHFPGHGDTNVDSHLDLPLIDRNMEEMMERELIPFKLAIEAGIPAIMTAHILFPKIEQEKIPATMSRKILQGILREKLGFKGMILSDCMMMNAIKDFYGVAKGCVQAVSAGVDLLFICHESPFMEESFIAINKAYEEGLFDANEFEQSIERIINFKKKYVNFGKDSDVESLEELDKRKKQNDDLTRSSLALLRPGEKLPPLGGKPLFIGSVAYRSSGAAGKPEVTSFARRLAEKLSGNFIESPVNPTPEEIKDILSKLPEVSSIILGTANGHINRGQIDLGIELLKGADARKIPFICLALRNPWDLYLIPEGSYGMAVWEYTEKAFDAAAAVLRGEFTPQGRLPC